MFKIKKSYSFQGPKAGPGPRPHMDFSLFHSTTSSFYCKHNKQLIRINLNICCYYKRKNSFHWGDINLLNFNRRCPENQENAYLKKRNARASRALRRALDPGRFAARCARTTPLRYVGKISAEIFWAPPLTKSWIR